MSQLRRKKSNISRYIAIAEVGSNIIDILNRASQVYINGTWFNVLGYDEIDDTLCAENHLEGKEDWIIPEASKIFMYLDFKVDVPVTES